MLLSKQKVYGKLALENLYQNSSLFMFPSVIQHPLFSCSDQQLPGPALQNPTSTTPEHWSCLGPKPTT